MVKKVKVSTLRVLLGISSQVSRELLGYLIDKMNYHNEVVLDAAAYQEEAGIDRTALWKALKRLEDDGLVRRAASPSWSRLYVNPHLVYPNYPNPRTITWWNSPAPRVGGPEPDPMSHMAHKTESLPRRVKHVIAHTDLHPEAQG